MARRGWGGSIATAIGVAAGAGAAQLGFGYGLGIIDWTAARGAGAGAAAWVASLAWASWITATSTIAGAVCARRTRRPDAHAPAGPGAVVLAAAGALGALVAVLLVAAPARVASVPGVTAPQAVAAGYAGAGVLIGLLVAVWALRSPAAAANVIATVGWLWLLAVVAVVDGVLAGRGLTAAQLGIWQFSGDQAAFWIRGWFYWPGALLALGSALLIGALAARRAARSAEHRLGAAASGGAGPLLVALAYLLAVPGLTALGREQVSAHLVAPYAVVVGFAGSVLAAALAQRAARRAAESVTEGGKAAPVIEAGSGDPVAESGSTTPAVVESGPGDPVVPRQRIEEVDPALGEPAAVPARARARRGAKARPGAETGSGGDAGPSPDADAGPAAPAGNGDATESAPDGVPGEDAEVAAQRKPPAVPKPRGTRRAR
jgi:hypothetical protein